MALRRLRTLAGTSNIYLVFARQHGDQLGENFDLAGIVADDAADLGEVDNRFGETDAMAEARDRADKLGRLGLAGREEELNWTPGSQKAWP